MYGPCGPCGPSLMMMGSPFCGPRFGPRASAAPSRHPVDSWETREAIIIAADVPGLSPEQVHVTISAEGQLTIKVEARQAAIPEGADELISERRHAGWERSFKLPTFVLGSLDRITTEIDRGQLTITLPKDPFFIANEEADKAEKAAAAEAAAAAAAAAEAGPSSAAAAAPEAQKDDSEMEWEVVVTEKKRE